MDHPREPADRGGDDRRGDADWSAREELGGGVEPAAGWARRWADLWSQRRLRYPAVAVAILAVLGLLTTTRPWQSAKSSTSAPSPPAGRSPASPPASPRSVAQVGVVAPPRTGLCYAYTFHDFSQSTENDPPIPCEDPRHNAFTVAVLPADGIDLPFDGDDRAAEAAVTACQDPVDRLTGVGRGVQFSTILGSVYEPSGLQLAAGQRWLRCDAVEMSLISGHNAQPSQAEFPSDLKALPATLQNLLVAGPDVRDALCVRPDVAWVRHLDDDPTMNGWSDLASCSDRGALVAVRAERAWPDGTRWPGPARANARSVRACHDASLRFVGLRLRPILAAKAEWGPTTLCVADVQAYRHWVEAGKPLSAAATLP